MSNKHLQIQDEDSLLDFIDNSFKNNYNQNEKYDKYDFYDLIKFDSLSQSKFSWVIFLFETIAFDWLDNLDVKDIYHAVDLQNTQNYFQANNDPKD